MSEQLCFLLLLCRRILVDRTGVRAERLRIEGRAMPTTRRRGALHYNGTVAYVVFIISIGLLPTRLPRGTSAESAVFASITSSPTSIHVVMSASSHPRLLPRLTFVLLALIFVGVLLLGRSVSRDRPVRATLQSTPLLITPTRIAPDYRRRLVVVVLSHAANDYRRMAIRRSWAKDANNHNCSVLFVVGTIADSNVSSEAELHNDIIQVNAQETYLGLTAKLMPAYAYLLVHAHFDYLLKTDDDVFVNLPLLVNQLLIYDIKKTVNTMIGHQILGATASTNQNDKYFALNLMAQLIPSYLSGTGYVMSMQVLHQVLQCPLPPLPYEDVYFTGVCREHFNVSLEHSQLFGYQRRTLVPCRLANTVIAHGLSAEQMTNAYNLTHSSHLHC